MKLKEISKEVYYQENTIVKINDQFVDYLEVLAINPTLQRIRLCTHTNDQEILQEMIIVLKKEGYIRPHKHLKKSESFHIIKCMLDVVIFKDEGEILEVIHMGDYHSGKSFYYRLSGPYFHTLILRTEYVVLHEATSGPFCKDETVYAMWSPAQEDKKLTNDFMLNLEQQVDSLVI